MLIKSRFEKSLYDLIKGLRSHKGAEDEYIQSSLRECKAEIKSQDMGTRLIYQSQIFDGILNIHRQKSHCTIENHIFRDVWLRHVLGLLSRVRSHVIYEIPAEESRLSWSNAEF